MASKITHKTRFLIQNFGRDNAAPTSSAKHFSQVGFKIGDYLFDWGILRIIDPNDWTALY
jgi:hypothetical protein